MKFSITNFFGKCDQIRRKLRIWSHLLKNPIMENFIFSVLQSTSTQITFYINYTVWNQFIIEILAVFYIQIWFKCEIPLLFLLIKTMVYRKIIFKEKKQISADYVKIIELHVTCNLRRWNNGGNYIDQKDQSKLNILKNSFFKYIWHKF